MGNATLSLIPHSPSEVWSQEVRDCLAVKRSSLFEPSSSGFVLAFLDTLARISFRFRASIPGAFSGGSSGTSLMRERWLSVADIAVHLGVNPDTIYKWITRKKMPVHKLGRPWRFLASEIDAWVKTGTAGQKETERIWP
jgi:excisionase family DNA binding protein